MVSAPVVDTEAPPKRRRLPETFERPVRALFDPSAVLSSMKLSFLLRVNSEEAAIVLICPLVNSTALS